MRLVKHSLLVSNIKKSLKFYEEKLGMKVVKSWNEADSYVHLSFGENDAVLELVQDENNLLEKSENNGYWKIAICIKDVDIARERLIKANVKVSEAFEVPNVAYLCHLFDPDGHCIELIAHKFKQNHTKEKPDENYKLGNKPVFSLITYRVSDIEKSLDFYIKTLGLKLYAKMDVSFRGFKLYFLAPDFEKLPNENVESIQNVEWLWQRDFTLIELQHVSNLPKNFTYNTSKTSGFLGLTFSGDKKQIFYDPDGYEIKI